MFRVDTVYLKLATSRRLVRWLQREKNKKKARREEAKDRLRT